MEPGKPGLSIVIVHTVNQTNLTMKKQFDIFIMGNSERVVTTFGRYEYRIIKTILGLSTMEYIIEKSLLIAQD
jgi:hypothetical protein